MKQILTWTAVAAIACIAVAAPQQKKELTPEEKAAQRERVLRHTGGLVEKPGTGLIVVLDTQGKIPRAAINEQSAALKAASRATVEVRAGKWVGVADAESVRKETGAQVAVFIVDDAALPMSLVAMEACWAMVNVAPLVADGMSGPDAAKVNLRFQREFVRVTSVLIGGGVSKFKGSPLQTVTDAKGLDSLLGEKYSFDYISGMALHLQKLGVTPSRRTIYRKACEEGWAPAPTNEYQKAIWDKVHEMPTAPIRILPETKKVLE